MAIGGRFQYQIIYHIWDILWNIMGYGKNGVGINKNSMIFHMI
jgi:hypothetical protein